MKSLLGAMMVAAITSSGGQAAEPPPPTGLERASISDLQWQIAQGRLSSAQLVQFYLDRIAKLDRTGPALHAVIALNPTAIVDAEALDRERALKGPRGPLHGIPILVKDNIETADPIATTAGSLALKTNITHRDSPGIARLRAAGAIILGKTNLSEWANFRSTRATSGWSAMGGLVKNPYALDRSACGSSSGSAVAVAAGFAAAAIGSETDGSIVCPASITGVVGLKPTLGLIPRTHIVPIAHSQDTAGPITHTVGDAALLAAIMSGSDPSDPATEAADKHRPPIAVTPAPLNGKQFGVLRFPEGQHPELTPVYEAALARLRAAGATLVEVKTPDMTKIGTDEQIVLNTEMKADLNTYLASAAPSVTVRTLQQLIDFNNATPAETALFGQELLLSAEATEGLDDPAYRQAREESEHLAGRAGIDRLLAADQLDALIAPTVATAWRVDWIYGDTDPGGFSTLPAVAGTPHLTVPMGLVHGLPLGLSLIGRKWSDEVILALGLSIEQILPRIPAPGFPATIAAP